jgi:phospho-N-acetylmuramoyl-pentapeptide-transferase
MLYHLLTWLDRLYDLTGFGVFQYLSFRAVLAVLFSLVISLLAGRYLISYLRRKLIGEQIRELGPSSHKTKAGTPTMGGLLIILGVTVPVLLWGNLTNIGIWLLLLSTWWMGLIGFLDDYIKVYKKDKKGLRGRFKVYGQVGLGLILGLFMVLHQQFQGHPSRVSAQGQIRVNEYLRSLGFETGDVLLAVDGQPYRPELIVSDEHPIYTYFEIKRLHKSSGRYDHHSIEVSEAESQRVCSELFGYTDEKLGTTTNVPFFKNFEFDYGDLIFWSDHFLWSKAVYVLVVIFIITAVSNGVNITDGLDGLAAGTSALVVATLGVFAYVSGHVVFADYLNITYIPITAELVIFAAALLGACVGFLWYNTYPAQVFMGDTGSLALGGAIGALALMVKKELLLPLICGIFFVESLSVIVQVSWFKYTKRKYGEGRRIFRMSPLHHHFELKGWHESKIVTRFWIITIFLELLAFATLKLR